MSKLFHYLFRKVTVNFTQSPVFVVLKAVWVFLPILTLAGICGCSKYPRNNETVSQRIISLAPSITETLFAMGLGDRVVGVTTYCVYPPEAQLIEKIGNYTDINLEKVIMLKPDLIILQQEHEKAQQFFRQYDLKTLTVDYSSIDSMCITFSRIGTLCGVQSKADSLIRMMDFSHTPATTNIVKPKVLLCVGRNSPGGGELSGVFIAGVSTFYDDLIRAAGGTNVFKNRLPNYPQLSKEGIISLAPDIVIDIAPSMSGSSCGTLISDWQVVRMVPAVKNGDVYCLSNDYSTIPGPRTGLLLNDFREILTPFINRQR